MGRCLRDAGATFHYHNHDYELEDLGGGTTAMDLLLGELDDTAVDLCVDVGLGARGGRDPAAFLAEHGERIGYLYLKDCQCEPGKTGREGLIWRELGNGVVDWDAVMEVVLGLEHVEWVLVEQDRTDCEPGESLRISRAFLQR